MNKMLSVGLAIISLGFVAQVRAIEGGCMMFDVVGLEVASSDDAESVGGRISGEVAIQSPSEAWAVVAGADYKSISLDWAREDREALGGDLGVKYYFTRMTGLSVFGRYEEYDIFGFMDVASANVLLDQKFMMPRSGVTPFVRLQAAFRAKDHDTGGRTEDNTSDDVLMKGILGSDFMLTDTLALTFEGGYLLITDSATTDDEFSDSVVAGISFKGYFD